MRLLRVARVNEWFRVEIYQRGEWAPDWACYQLYASRREASVAAQALARGRVAFISAVKTKLEHSNTSKAMETKPDYETAKDEIQALWESLKLDSTIEGPRRMKRDGWDCNRWRLEVRGEMFFYHTGMGISVTDVPSPAIIIASVANDGDDAARSHFKDWAGDCGLSDDSIKALETYKACKHGFAQLLKIGLSEDQIRQFADLARRL